MSKGYEAIIYDLDGTLTDSIPLIMKTFKLAYKEVFGKVERTDEDLMSYIGKPLMQTFSDVHDEKTARLLFDTYLSINEKMLANNELLLFPGVRDSLARIKEAGVPQAIVTSKRFSSARITLELQDLNGLFDQGVFLEDTKEHKPSPEPLFECARRLGITDMSKVVYVGDAAVDFECAINAGADFALVSWTRMDIDGIRRLGQPRIISKLEELL